MCAKIRHTFLPEAMDDEYTITVPLIGKSACHGMYHPLHNLQLPHCCTDHHIQAGTVVRLGCVEDCWNTQIQIPQTLYICRHSFLIFLHQKVLLLLCYFQDIRCNVQVFVCLDRIDNANVRKWLDHGIFINTDDFSNQPIILHLLVYTQTVCSLWIQTKIILKYSYLPWSRSNEWRYWPVRHYQIPVKDTKDQSDHNVEISYRYRHSMWCEAVARTMHNRT